MRHLPFYERWFRFLTFYPGAGLSIENSRIDPAYDDGSGLAVSPGNEVTRQLFSSWIESQVGDDPELLAKVMPDYPATGKRTLQDNGVVARVPEARQRRPRAHVDRADRRRRGRHDRRHALPGRRPLLRHRASGTTTTCGR